MANTSVGGTKSVVVSASVPLENIPSEYPYLRLIVRRLRSRSQTQAVFSCSSSSSSSGSSSSSRSRSRSRSRNKSTVCRVGD